MVDETSRNSPLLSLTKQQWEDICDGCGRCCMVKLEDEDTGEIHYTNVACRFLNTANCRCSDYENRAKINSRCIVLSPDNLDILDSMPYTCAYRLVHEGRELEDPAAKLSVSHRAVSEEYIHEDQLPDHIINWIQANGE